MKQQIAKNGFIKIANFFSNDEINSMVNDIKIVASFIGDDFSFVGPDPYKDNNTIKQSQLYDQLKYLPSLYKIASSDKVLNLARELGCGFPAIMKSCNMRIDKPNNMKHLFDWHQDSLYLLGSYYALTFWIPMTPVNANNGSVEVIPGTHLSGIYPYEKISDKSIDKMTYLLQRDVKIKDMSSELEEQKVLIDANVGDVIVFYQMLLHRSTPNISNQTRWTAQVRISDLLDKSYYEQGCPMGEVTNIYYTDYKK